MRVWLWVPAAAIGIALCGAPGGVVIAVAAFWAHRLVVFGRGPVIWSIVALFPAFKLGTMQFLGFAAAGRSVAPLVGHGGFLEVSVAIVLFCMGVASLSSGTDTRHELEPAYEVCHGLAVCVLILGYAAPSPHLVPTVLMLCTVSAVVGVFVFLPVQRLPRTARWLVQEFDRRSTTWTLALIAVALFGLYL